MFHFHSPVAKQKGSMPHHSMAVNNIIIFNYPWIIGAFRLIVASHPIAFAKEKKFQNLFKRKGNRAVFKQIISPLPKKFSFIPWHDGACWKINGEDEDKFLFLLQILKCLHFNGYRQTGKATITGTLTRLW